MSDNWTTLSAAAVMEAFTPAEIVALKAEADAEDRLPAFIVNVIAEFRQAISDGGGELNGDETTIPPGFKGKAIDLARLRWLAAFPRYRPLCTKERKDAAEKAEALIESIASGDRAVTTPAGGTSQTGATLVRNPGSNPFRGIGGT